MITGASSPNANDTVQGGTVQGGTVRAALGSGPVGLLLAACLAGWALLVHPDAPGGVDVAVVVLLGAAGAVTGWALSREQRELPGAVLAGAVAVAFVLTLPGSIGGAAAAPPLGYANADAALLVTATAGVLLGAGQVEGRQRVPWTVAAVAFTVATVLTGSRAAVVSCLLLLGLWAVLPRLRTVGWRWLAAGLLVAAVGTTVVLGLTSPQTRTSPAAERLAPEAVAESVGGTRAALWADALAMVGNSPATGYGAGTFADRSALAADPDLAWAHSEPLQVAAELGLVGATLAALLVAWVLLACDSSAVLVAVVLLPATVDYVLHFPAVVLSVGVVVGTAVAVGAGSQLSAPASH